MYIYMYIYVCTLHRGAQYLQNEMGTPPLETWVQGTEVTHMYTYPVSTPLTNSHTQSHTDSHSPTHLHTIPQWLFHMRAAHARAHLCCCVRVCVQVACSAHTWGGMRLHDIAQHIMRSNIPTSAPPWSAVINSFSSSNRKFLRVTLEGTQEPAAPYWGQTCLFEAPWPAVLRVTRVSWRRPRV